MTQGVKKQITWSALESSLRPSWMPADTWTVLFGNLTAQIGSTWGDYVQMMSDNAAYLGRLGIDVKDVSELFSFEMQQADGLNPVSTLDSAVDASLPTPGLPLGFGRSFGNTILDRYAGGVFGRGWTAPTHSFATEETRTELRLLPDPNWVCTAPPGQICGPPPLTLQPVTFLDAVVINGPGGSQRRFFPDVWNTSRFNSAPGETGVLRRVTLPDSSQRYELVETSGFLSRFFASGTLKGKLEYDQDVNGNRITSGYTTGRLTSLTHSSGASLTHRTTRPGGSRASPTRWAGDDLHLRPDQHTPALGDGPGGTTTYTYSTGAGAAREHALLSVTDPSGVMRHFDYDARGRLTATYLTGNVERVEYTYDEAGRVTVTDAAGVTSTLFFDHRGLVVRSEDGPGNYVRYEYDNAGQLDPRDRRRLGRSRSYTWCGCGSLTSDDRRARPAR